MLKSVILPNGVYSDYTYDDLNRLTSIVHEDAVDTLLAEFHYSMRLNGQRYRVEETLRDESNVLTSRQVDYIYDDLGRLIEEISQSTAASLQYDTKYTLDLVGNRLQKQTIQGGNTDVIDYVYNARDELRVETPSHNGTTGAVTNYDYDLNGSRIEKTTVGGDSASYTFDLRNRLSAAEIDRTEDGHNVHAETSYEYNDSGIRVTSGETITVDSGTPTTTNKVFLTDANNPSGYAQVLEERASPSSAPTMTYVIGPDVLSQTSPSATHYFGFDGIGSTRQLITSSAVVAASYSYDAYGIQITNPSSILDGGVTTMRFSGVQFDSVLQDTYLRSRYLDSNVGHFTSRDTLIGSFNSPLSLHQQLYVHADPINNVDPSGQFPLAAAERGKAAHILIEGLYRTQHRGDVVEGNTKPWSGGPNIRPDITNISKKTVAEIKSEGELPQGLVEISGYLKVANQLSLAGSNSWVADLWNPGPVPLALGIVNPAFSNSIAIVTGNVSGVITYHIVDAAAQPQMLPLPVPVIEENTKRVVEAAKQNPGYEDQLIFSYYVSAAAVIVGGALLLYAGMKVVDTVNGARGVPAFYGGLNFGGAI